ncbi:MAG TPA: adenylosuccinate lyase [Nitrospinota bacterium]|nr:adenylosuccinate lyase [Nitrospinota bacterium]|tara:strand:+ start:35938 stop:37242 length:1305 start_codon:yes stop_codon:yes gene_type:complete
MIPRYTRPEMERVWTLENKFATWLKVEIFACEAWAEKGKIPKKSLRTICKKAKFNLERIAEIEASTHHDVIAFLTSVNESVGHDSRYIHMGLTSSDVVDTSMSVLMVEALDLILDGLDKLLETTKRRAYELKNTLCIGRTHGVHAEPTTFGLKIALWHEEMKRNRQRLLNARSGIAVGKISGAVGTYANVGLEIEEYVCGKLGLRPAPISTQIIQRDRHAEYMSALGILASSIEKIAVELRHLQRTEVLEVEEYFHMGQKGSSAMPHKRNPITSENLTGLARVVKANVSAALDDVALWHERDISHSSTERIIVPDSTILVDNMINKLDRLLDQMLVYPENMLKNIEETMGLIFSQRVLLALTDSGMSREEAYELVQRVAMKCWAERKGFMDLLLSEPKVSKVLGKKHIREIFDCNYYLKHIDEIFKRVFEGAEK